MKRINQYRKLFDAKADTSLSDLKKSYRNLVKEWHPDKFQPGDARAAEAERMSREIIAGYDFLVSLAPETIEAEREIYNTTIENGAIADYHHKGLVMQITFTDGSSYEYFGVTPNVFKKFTASDKLMRMAKRSILFSYPYRRLKEPTSELQES